MKPVWAFLYILLTLSLFYLVSYFVLPPIQQALQSTSEVVASSDSLTSQLDTLKVVETLSVKPDTLLAASDSVTQEIHEPVTTIADVPELALASSDSIQYPAGDRHVLEPFFLKLKNLGANEDPLHVLYYGDSQIEMDRITSTIRKRLQTSFGGTGVGLIPLEPIYNPANHFEVQLSSGWKTVDLHAQKLNYHISSVLFKDAMLESNEGSFKIKQGNYGSASSGFRQIRIYYTSEDKFEVKAIVGGKTTYSRKVEPSAEVKTLDFNFEIFSSDVEFFFQAKGLLRVTGLSVATDNGVMVDNVALRGYSLPPFSKLDPVNLKAMMTAVSPSLCILHFGVNLAPYYQRDYQYYKSQLVGEIRIFQQLMPNTPILIVGISDLAKRVDGQMVSYPNVETIKRAQVEAAKACNCAFWDLEKFMGGKGSMVKWVNSNPRLGQKDYIHFTAEGTEIVGNKIGDLLMSDFKTYLAKTLK